MEALNHNNIPEDCLDSIYAITDIGFPIIVIAGRIYVIDGDITMADSFQANEEHYIVGKDVTSYIYRNAIHLSKNLRKEEFATYIRENIKTRKFRFHKEERYVRYSN